MSELRRVIVLLACTVVLCANAFAQTSAPGPIPQVAGGPDHGFVVLKQLDRVRYDVDGRRVRDVSRDVRITGAAGLETWRDLTTWYAADRERVSLVRLEVIKASGERVRPANLALEDRRQSGVFEQKVFGDLTESHITVPSLAVGDQLSYELRIITSVPEPGGAFWESHVFYDLGPIDEEIVQVEVPTARPVAVWTRPGVGALERDDIEGSYRVLRWRRGEHRPAAGGAADTGEGTDAPGADIHVSSLVSWRAAGAWYGTVLSGVAAPGAAVSAKARQLTAGASTPEERLRALYGFVAREIRYVSLAFGIGRLEPRPPDLVLETGYGDCKDKHVLLAALAQSIGLTLEPVLIGSSVDLVESAPSPAQFDHVISVWRPAAEPESWRWLDSTTGFTGPNVLLPLLRDKQALLVDASGEHRLVRTPKGARLYRTEATLTGTLAATGEQVLAVRRRETGDGALLIRVLQAAKPGAETAKELASSLLSSDGLPAKSEVTEAALDVPDDPEAPVTLSYTARIKYGLTSSLKKQALWIPGTRLDLPDPDALPEPWRLPIESEQQYVITTNYTLPDSWQGEAPVDVALTLPFARYTSRYKAAGRHLTIERRLDLLAGEVKADQRAAYTRFRKSVTEDHAQEFGLKTTAASAANAADDLFGRALAAYSARRFDEAGALLEQLTSKQPEHAQAWNELGRVQRAQGNAEKARALFEKQIAVNPLTEHAYANLGDMLQIAGRMDLAEAAYRKQMEVVPLSAYAHRALGLLLLTQKRSDEAIAELERAVSLARDDRFSRLYLGKALLAAGQTARAVGLFDEIAAMVPPHPDHLNEAAYWLAEADVELPRARGWAERAIALAHGAVGAGTPQLMRDFNMTPMATVVHLWDTLGWIAFKLGDRAAASLWLEAAYAWSDNAEVNLHVGRLREAEGRSVEALVAYTRAKGGAPPGSTGGAAVQAAEQAVRRLEESGVAMPRRAASDGVAFRESRLQVPAVKAAASGELIAAIATDGTADDVLLLSDAAALAPLGVALKGKPMPGADIARARQVRLFRKGSASCTATGACTIVWHLIP